MADLLLEVKKYLTSGDDVSRRLFQRALLETITSLETPKETALRMSFYPLETAAIRIGHDLKIFQTLSSEGPQTLQELQALTGAHPLTLVRILRYMAAVGLVNQIAVDKFEANSKSRNLAAPESIKVMANFYVNGGPLFQELPVFLKNNGYNDVTDSKATVFQSLHNTELDAFTWYGQNPENHKRMIEYMGLEQDARKVWLEKYPFENEMQAWNPTSNETLFVDIGGNVGHYCALFRRKFADNSGRIVLEDLPHVVAKALPTPGVEKLGHDFFQPQPVKDAKFYHLGWVLHNWTDEKARIILGHIKSAMTPRSVLLINDMILPETDAPSFSTAMDLTMLCGCAGLERTGGQWKKLLGEVGLEIKGTMVYNHELFHGIISATVA